MSAQAEGSISAGRASGVDAADAGGDQAECQRQGNTSAPLSRRFPRCTFDSFDSSSFQCLGEEAAQLANQAKSAFQTMKDCMLRTAYFSCQTPVASGLMWLVGFASSKGRTVDVEEISVACGNCWRVALEGMS